MEKQFLIYFIMNEHDRDLIVKLFIRKKLNLKKLYKQLKGE